MTHASPFPDSQTKSILAAGAFPYKKYKVLCFSGLRADFSISSRNRVISTPAPHSPCAADSLPDSNYAPVGAYVLQEVLFSTPNFPALLSGFSFLLPWSFLNLQIFFFLPFSSHPDLGILTLSSTHFLYDSI